MKNELQNLIIRKAKEQDHEAVNVLYHVIYDMYHKKLPGFYKKQPKECLPKGTFLNMLDDKEGLVIVAEIDKNIVGVLCATVEKDSADAWAYARKRMRIDEIAVLPEHFRKEIGTKLMQEAQDWAKKKKINSLIVLAYACNQEALSFYRAIGCEQYSIEMSKKF